MATERTEPAGKKCSSCGGEIVKVVVDREDYEWVKDAYCEDCGIRYNPSSV